jgi:hypothetical protein
MFRPTSGHHEADRTKTEEGVKVEAYPFLYKTNVNRVFNTVPPGWPYN